MINESIAKLVKYGENAGLVSGLDKIYATNRILEVMQISDYEEPEQIPETPDLEETLNELLDDAAKRGLLEHNSVVYRDLFDTKLMDCLMPRPGEVVKKFEELYAKSPQEATDYFYKLSQDSNYIRRYRIAKDIRWSVPSAYGDIDISINLSKPEKDPKAIAAAKLAKQSGYPKCLLCKENVGYAGRVNHPARQNHRIIPLTINQTEWGFQYSPYVYYNEHCIVFNFQHNPMKIERATFVKLLTLSSCFRTTSSVPMRICRSWEAPFKPRSLSGRSLYLRNGESADRAPFYHQRIRGCGNRHRQMAAVRHPDPPQR